MKKRKWGDRGAEKRGGGRSGPRRFGWKIERVECHKACNRVKTRVAKQKEVS